MFRNNWKEQLYSDLMKLDPEHIIGIAKLLKITLCDYVDEKPVPRDAEQILLGIFCTVEDMNRGQRRNFLKLVKKAAKEKSEVSDGPTTEDN